MIISLIATYYRWSPSTGGWERIYSAEPRLYDLDIAPALVGASEATIGCEENGGKAIASDMPLTIANTAFYIYPTGFDGNLALGDLERDAHGIVAPLLTGGGTAAVVAIGVAYALREGNSESETRPESIDGSLITGAVNTYSEFIEEIPVIDMATGETTSVDAVVILPGYLEPYTFRYDVFADTGEMSFIALDKLLEYLLVKDMDLPTQPNMSQIVGAIMGKAPFIEASLVEAIGLGSVYWLVKKAEHEYTDDDSIPPGSAFVFNKIIQWSYIIGSSDIQYCELTEGVNRFIELSTDITLLSATPDRYIHSAFAIDATFDLLAAKNPSKNGYHPALLSSVMPEEEGYTKAPYLLDDVMFYQTKNTISSCLVTNSENLLYGTWTGGTYPAMSGLFCFFITEYDGGKLAFLAWNGTDNWDGSLWHWTDFDAIGNTKMHSVYRSGYKRIWILGDDKTTLYSYPAPETGSFSTLDTSPTLYSDTIVTHKTAGVIDGGASGFDGSTILLIAPHLGTGDIEDFLIVDLGGTYEKHYRLYPIYWKHESRTGVRLHADAIGSGATGFDFYGVGNLYGDATNFETCFKDFSSSNNGISPTPDDMPDEPIFVYDIRDRLQIWYYSDNWLHCYDWKMKLKYDFHIGLPENRVALGRSGDGKLLVVFSLDTGLVSMKFESTDNPTWLVVDSDDDLTAADMLTRMCEQMYASWWIDRIDGKNKIIVKNRFGGTPRGEVGIVAHSFQGNVSTGLSVPPNRTLTREYWESFADHIEVKDSKSRVMAIAGMAKSMYSYTYTLSEAYHEQLGERIAQKLLLLLGTRREKLTVPLSAWRGGAYDYITLYGRSYCVLTQKTDFSRTMKTDLTVISLSRQTLDSDLLRCTLRSFFNWQGGSWEWDKTAVSVGVECAGIDCPACYSARSDFMEAVLVLLNEHWPIESPLSAPGAAWDNPDIVSEIEGIIFEYWTDAVAGGFSLAELFERYNRCVVSLCSWGGA